jgi:hypothetical protein
MESAARRYEVRTDPDAAPSRPTILPDVPPDTARDRAIDLETARRLSGPVSLGSLFTAGVQILTGEEPTADVADPPPPAPRPPPPVMPWPGEGRATKPAIPSALAFAAPIAPPPPPRLDARWLAEALSAKAAEASWAIVLHLLRSSDFWEAVDQPPRVLAAAMRRLLVPGTVLSAEHAVLCLRALEQTPDAFGPLEAVP